VVEPPTALNARQTVGDRFEPSAFHRQTCCTVSVDRVGDDRHVVVAGSTRSHLHVGGLTGSPSREGAGTVAIGARDETAVGRRRENRNQPTHASS
jgi:hypothetical protein